MPEKCTASAACRIEHTSEESSSTDRTSDQENRKEIITPRGGQTDGARWRITRNHQFYICIARLFSPSLKNEMTMEQEQIEWYEVKVKFDETKEDGFVKPTTNSYLVDAKSFAEAEQRVIECEFAHFNEAYEVKACAIRKYQDILRFSPGEADANFYKCKVNVMMLDEKSGKEKPKTITILVQSLNFTNAVIGFRDHMQKCFGRFEIESVQRTKIVKLIPYAA